MMRVAFYGGRTTGITASLARGVEELGDGVLWCDDDHVPKAADCAVIRGAGGRSKVTAPLLRRAGIPFWLMDLPAIRRVPQVDGRGPEEIATWYCGLNQLAGPALRDHGNRWRRWLVDPIDRRGSYAVLICGQSVGDNAHGMDEQGIQRWAECAADRARELYPGAPLIWRPHPGSRQIRPRNVATVSDPKETQLIDDLARSVVVMTYNSTAGVSALRLVVPVICDESAVYARWSVSGDRDAMLRALSPHQWTISELSGGAAWFELRKVIEQRTTRSEVA